MKVAAVGLALPTLKIVFDMPQETNLVDFLGPLKHRLSVFAKLSVQFIRCRRSHVLRSGSCLKTGKLGVTGATCSIKTSTVLMLPSKLRKTFSTSFLKMVGRALFRSSCVKVCQAAPRCFLQFERKYKRKEIHRCEGKKRKNSLASHTSNLAIGKRTCHLPELTPVNVDLYDTLKSASSSLLELYSTWPVSAFILFVCNVDIKNGVKQNRSSHTRKKYFSSR